jgi:peptide-methionine (R)-S-oxide reductase
MMDKGRRSALESKSLCFCSNIDPLNISPMNKRTFLKVGVAWLGSTYFLNHWFRRSSVMAASQEQFAVTKTEAEWQQSLGPEEFRVLRKHGTERAGTSPLDKQYTKGTYYCAGCNQALFSSDTKFNSGTGWPSFYDPLNAAIATSTDRSFFTVRTEVHCSNCGGHLGHVFDDGPAPTGKRYCMNGVALKFTPEV